MIHQLINLDKDLLLLLNSWHNEILDFIMFWISEKITWVPFYLFLLYHVIRNFKLRSVDVLVAVVLLISLSDLTSVYGFKEVFQRLRPCHDPVIGSQVQLVYDQCGGKFSFVSSHAVNTFALCFFLISILGTKIKWLTVTLIIWASVVSFSRIYLGVHYPFDVFCGAILGAGIGITMGKLFNTYYEKFVVRINKS